MSRSQTHIFTTNSMSLKIKKWTCENCDQCYDLHFYLNFCLCTEEYLQLSQKDSYFIEINCDHANNFRLILKNLAFSEYVTVKKYFKMNS